jgi:hypothetical protein
MANINKNQSAIHLQWNVSIKDVILALSNAKDNGYEIDYFSIYDFNEWKELVINLK